MAQINFTVESYEIALMTNFSEDVIALINCYSSKSEKKFLQFTVQREGVTISENGKVQVDNDGRTRFIRWVSQSYYAWIIDSLRNSKKVEARCQDASPFKHGIHCAN